MFFIGAIHERVIIHNKLDSLFKITDAICERVVFHDKLDWFIK